MKKQKVQVWIYKFHEDNFFLLLRTKANRGSFWQPVTGSVKRNESKKAAARREAREETGIEFIDYPKELNFSFEYIKGEVTFHETVYYYWVHSDNTIVLDKTEHEEFLWAKSKNVEQMLRFSSNLEAFRLLLPIIER